MSGAILFGGKAIPGIDRLQERWHAGNHRFEAALPVSGRGSSWPAAFPPFRTGNGIEIACLTDEAELKGEGGRFEDEAGVPGLDHCVGGYGRQCFTGQSHVASIRRITGAGYERLSTVEFTPAHEAPGLDLSQHFGKGNGRPGDEALDALASLVVALDENTHPLDPEALAERGAEGFADAYDHRAPGAIGQAFAAWSSYLPRDIARGGVPVLAERIEAVLRELPPMPEAAPPARPRILVMDAGLVPLRRPPIIHQGGEIRPVALPPGIFGPAP